MSDVQLMQQILDQTRAMVKMRKNANFSDIRGENPDTLPGSEHDKPVTVPGADSEVKKRFPGEPAGARTMAGAGDNSPVTRGHAMTAEESALTPKKKPAIENETMEVELDKDGSATLGNDLLSTIKKYRTEKNASVKVASEGESAKDPTEGKKLADTGADSNEDKNVPSLPNKADATPKAKDPVQSTSTDGGIPKASETGNYIELSQDILAKIASVLLSTQEGCEFAEAALAKAAGAEAAKETMNFINEQREEAEKVASYNQGQKDAEHFISQLLSQEMEQGYKTAYDRGAAETVEYLKSAGLLNEDKAKQAEAYNSGKQLAEALILKAAQDIMAQSPAGAEGVPVAPDAAMGAEGVPAMPEAAMGAEPAPEMAGDEAGEDSITAEEIGQALAEMVQAGELSEEEAAQIIQAIDEAAGGGMEGVEQPVPEGGVAEGGKSEEGSPESAEAEGEKESVEEEVGEKESSSPVSELLTILKKAKIAASTKQASAKKAPAKAVTKKKN